MSKSVVASDKRTACLSFLVLTLLSGCSGSATPPKKTAEQVARTNAPVQAQGSPDDLLQARLQAAMRTSAQNRVSRRSIPWMSPEVPSAAKLGTRTVTGRLPPEVIQRIVRAHFSSFRRCYEEGLTTSPNLSGRISVRFTIQRDGSVSDVTDAGSNISDERMMACVLKAFSTLSFPQPEGGIVKIVYPINFTPGDSDTPTPSSAASAVAAPNPLSSATVTPVVSPPVPNAIDWIDPAPIVVIDGLNIQLNGMAVGSTYASFRLGRILKIDELFTALKSRREDWKAKHPGEPFAGVIGLRADSNTPLVVFKSTFQTIAFAGYPNIYVQTTSDPVKIIEFAAQVPGPPDPTAIGDIPTEPAPELHIMVGQDEAALIWNRGPEIFATERRPRKAAFTAAICQSWKVNGRRHELTDIQQDALVVHADNALPLSAVTSIVQAAETCTRDVKNPNGTVEQMPNFWVTFSMR